MIEPPTDPEVTPARKKAMVYVDGFNLYFGILQGSPDLKWLNLQSFMDFLRPDEEVVGVRYFTALVDPQNSSISRDRQKRYLQALGSCSRIKVVREVSDEGGELSRPLPGTIRSAGGEKDGCGHRRPHDSDAIDRLMDRIILVSGDSDLEPAVEWIRSAIRQSESRFTFRKFPENPNKGEMTL